ncbi:MAG: glycerophosphodiester phosphodiesterase family protein [Bauldia sp.]
MDDRAPAVGVSIADGGRRVMLKWHMLRRAADDPPFSIANLRLGLAAGASLEIDVRALADGAWVCLHDDGLDEETDGSGPVKAADTAAIGKLRISGSDYAPPLLDQIAREVAITPDAGGCLQIDLKEPAEGLSSRAIGRFAAAIAPVAGRCRLSGTDWNAVRTLAEAVPSLSLGFDPLDLAAGRGLADADSINAFVEEVAATAPAASAFYVHYRFVERALSFGINPVRRLKQNGAMVDIWTLDPSTPDIGDVLRRMVEAGADQITTNDPIEMAALWQRRARGGKDSGRR